MRSLCKILAREEPLRRQRLMLNPLAKIRSFKDICLFSSMPFQNGELVPRESALANSSWTFG